MNIKLYFKLKKYLLPRVETEIKVLYLGKIHFHLLLADRSIPTDYFKLLLPKARTCNCALRLK